MLYHVTFQIDQQALGFEEQRSKVVAAEAEATVRGRAEGSVKAVWTRADGYGTISIIEADDHDAVSQIIQSRPIFRFLATVAVVPLVEFAAPAAK